MFQLNVSKSSVEIRKALDMFDSLGINECEETDGTAYLENTKDSVRLYTKKMKIELLNAYSFHDKEAGRLFISEKKRNEHENYRQAILFAMEILGIEQDNEAEK